MKHAFITLLLVFASTCAYSGSPGPDNPGQHSHGKAYAQSDHGHDLSHEHPSTDPVIHNHKLSNWYGGVGIGLTQNDICDQAYNTSPGAQASAYTDDYPPPKKRNASCNSYDEEELSWRMYFGKESIFNIGIVKVGAEIGYTDLGEAINTEVDAITLETIIRVPIGSSWNLLGTAGTVYVDATIDDTFEGLWGLGAEWSINNRYRLRGQYRNINEIDTDEYTLSLQRFF